MEMVTSEIAEEEHQISVEQETDSEIRGKVVEHLEPEVVETCNQLRVAEEEPQVEEVQRLARKNGSNEANRSGAMERRSTISETSVPASSNWGPTCERLDWLSPPGQRRDYKEVKK